jgi:hypothetical protein
MGINIKGSLNVKNIGTTINKNSSADISINQYSRINRNGSININTDPGFGSVVYSTNLIVYCGGNPDQVSTTSFVTILGGQNYIILQGTFPVYANPADGNTVLYGHHFGGTRIDVGMDAAVIYVYKNGIEQGGGNCYNPFFGPFIFNFTETDIITINGDYCGG